MSTQRMPRTRQILEVVDSELVNEAVEHINALHRAKALELVVAMGDYILDVFFCDDSSRLKLAKANASWRALCKRPDLNVSHSQLWYSAAIVGQLRTLPDAVGKALPVSHHRRLIAVRDDSVKSRLATRAATEGMSVKELEAAIAAERSNGGVRRPGRQPIPAHLKSLGG